MPIDTSPGGTDVIDLSGNGKGVDINSISMEDLFVLEEVATSTLPLPDVGCQIVFIDSADHQLKRKDNSGTITIIG